MKIKAVKAPKDCFYELEKWFSIRRMEGTYPPGWNLTNTFANCKPMRIYRFPLKLLGSPEFHGSQMELSGWSFIHEDLNGKLGNFWVNTVGSKEEVMGYEFSHANYGMRATQVLHILDQLRGMEGQGGLFDCYIANILIGGPKFTSSIWLQPTFRGKDLFIKLAPNFYPPQQDSAASDIEIDMFSKDYELLEHEDHQIHILLALDHYTKHGINSHEERSRGGGFQQE
ncbi:MAG: hypothetical protein AAFY71_11445 [Bacteroidota bacterium]